MTPLRFTGARPRLGQGLETVALSGAELEVRIHSPPAKSHANHRFLSDVAYHCGGSAGAARSKLTSTKAIHAPGKMRIVLARPDGAWDSLGGTRVSTGQMGRRDYYLTPTGIFLHTDLILDWRAERESRGRETS